MTFFKGIRKYLFFTIFLHSLEVSATNLYSILGVSPQASTAEIVSSYRRLAQKWHPDKNSSPNAKAMFMKIRQAYEILKDPDLRWHYDQRRHLYDSGVLTGSHKDDIINSINDSLTQLQMDINNSFIRLQMRFIINMSKSYWSKITEIEKRSILQYSMSLAFNNSESVKSRKDALYILNLAKLSLSELNQLNHLANDEQAPRAIRSKARKIVKKASQSRNACSTMFMVLSSKFRKTQFNK